MLGPVFYLEMLLGGRRGRQHFLRWFVGALLTLQLLFFYIGYYKNLEEGRHTLGITPAAATSQFATSFLIWVLNQQYLIVLLATPAFTAGAITDEKTRGTLMYLFSADLTAWEILVGKFLGRVFEVVVLLLTTLPFVCFVGVWAGVTPLALLAIVLGLAGPLVAVGAASLLMSVWCRQTRDAVIGLFAIGGLLYLLWSGLGWLGRAVPAASGLQRLAAYFDPLHSAAPALAGAEARDVLAHVIGSWVAWGSVGLTCFGVAVWRLRAAYLRQLEHSGQRGLGELIAPKRPDVSDEPMLWKERHVDGIAPLAILKVVPRWFALPAISLLTVLLVVALVAASTGRPFGQILEWFLTMEASQLLNLDPGDVAGAFFLLGGIVLVLASLVVGIRCSGTISGEREKQTWEALLLSPLATQQLIRIKLWGILGAAAPYVLAYMVPALVMATLVSPPETWVLMGAVGGLALILALVFRRQLDSFRTFWAFFASALLTMVGSLVLGAPTLFLVLLTTVVTTLAMFYMGAAGIWSSTRFTSSWRSLLATLGIGYVGGLVLWLVTTPITLIVAFMIWAVFMMLSEADRLLGTQTAGAFKSLVGPGASLFFGVLGSCIVMAATFFGVPWLFIKSAEKRVSERERVRVWREGEFPGGARRKRRYRTLKKA